MATATPSTVSATADASSVVNQLIERGREELAKGDAAKASKTFAEAVGKADAVGERVGMRRFRSQSAGVHLLRAGRAKESLVHLQQAVVSSTFGSDDKDRLLEIDNGRTLYCLAIAYASLGNHTAAVEHYKKSLSIYKKHEMFDQEARGLLRLATSYLGIPGKENIALKCYDRAEKLYERAQSDGWLAYVHALRASYLQRAGEQDEAVSGLELAVIALQSGRVMASVGSTYASLGKYSVATACFKQALAAAKQQGDNKQNEATFTANIAAMLTLANKTDEAISYSEAAISIFESIGCHSSLAVALANMGQAQLQANKLHEAAQTVHRAVNIAKQYKDVTTAAQCAEILADVHTRQNNYIEARRCYRAALKSHSLQTFDASNDVHRVVAKLRKLDGEDGLDASGMLNQSQMSNISSLSTALQRIAPPTVATQVILSPNIKSVAALSSDSSGNDSDCFNVSSDLSISDLEEDETGDVPDGKRRGMGKIVAARTNRRRSSDEKINGGGGTPLLTRKQPVSAAVEPPSLSATATPVTRRPARELASKPPALDLSSISNKRPPKPPRHKPSNSTSPAAAAAEGASPNLAHRRVVPDAANQQLIANVMAASTPHAKELDGFTSSGGLKLQEGLVPFSPLPTESGRFMRPRRSSSAGSSSSICVVL